MAWLLIVPVIACVGLAALAHLIAKAAEARVPAEGRFIDLSGARLHVVERDATSGASVLNPALVLVHGLGGQWRHFGYALLDDLARSHRVIAIDRPGAGYSRWRPGARRTLEAQADLVADLIQTLGLDRAVVVGHSLGGAIALATALRHRDRVSGIALLAPLTMQPEGLPRRWPTLLRALLSGMAMPIMTLLVPLLWLGRRGTLTMIFSPDAVPEDYGVRGGGS